MTSIPDHYAALGIDPTADQEVITAAYRALAKKFHPDTGATTGTANPERFEQIQQAYEVLRTPESRHRYDLELLEASERELAERLAAKRRVVPYGAEPAAPPPDLGDIRPEPAIRPSLKRPAPRRSVGPFLVPVVLLLAIAGGGAWLFLPKSPEAPPLPAAPRADVAVATPRTEPPPVTQPPAAPTAPEQPPLFGSSVTDGEGPAPTVEARATSAPVPEPDAADGKPLFGSSVEEAPAAAPVEDAPADDAAPPPVPKPRPVQAARPAQPPPAKPQPAPQAQPDPGPDLAAQPDAADAEGPFRLVIFQRPPGGETMAWSAGVLFDTQGRCTRFGVKAVLRRLANVPPGFEPPKIWYECQPR